MITNDNKGTYLVKNGQKHDNVIYERPLVQAEPHVHSSVHDLSKMCPA